MKNHIHFITLAFLFSSCGKTLSHIAIENREEHVETLVLDKGDKVSFWTKIKYQYENDIYIRYSVKIYKNDSLYKQLYYNPLSTNLRYMSSDERWIISRTRNPDWVRHRDQRFTVFGWVKNEDEREEHQKQKHIIKYGIKKNVKGKNKPIFIVEEGGEYTIKAQLYLETENQFVIKRALILFKK